MSGTRRWKPRVMMVAGERFKTVVLQVTERGDDGRPRAARFFYEEETVPVEGGEEFLVVYASERGLKPKLRH